jgi:hypothetical protein
MDYQALVAHSLALEARLTLCESAVASLLAVLARSSHDHAEVIHEALKSASRDVLQEMAASADSAADARVARTANTFIRLSNPNP